MTLFHGFKHFLNRKLVRSIFIFSGLLVGGLCGVGFVYIGVITHQLDSRIEQLHRARGTRFYALPQNLRVHQIFSQKELVVWLQDQGYRARAVADSLLPGEFSWKAKGENAEMRLVRNEFRESGLLLEQARFEVKLTRKDRKWQVTSIINLDRQQGVEFITNPPKKMASFVAGRLRTQDSVSLSEIPVSLRLAVIAIEDAYFLEHPGMSLRGTLRALWNDLRKGGFVEGGSTITQQLMKNLFFSKEKEISRKIKEAIFAFITESRHSKETILEAYLNEVYLGQAGPREIHGVSEGTRHYFRRSVSELELHQSALLAAIIQAPNTYDPQKRPDRALKRRNIVLKQMLNNEFILEGEYEEAIKRPLGVTPVDRTLNDADYFTDLAMEQLPTDVFTQIDTQTMTVYTPLDPYLQLEASRLVRANIQRLIDSVPSIKAQEAKGIYLQSALLALNAKDCSILALQGGRSYKQTQFNRVMQGKRQAGSLFKPFVVIPALSKMDEPFITPSSVLEDAPFEWKYDGQIWSPRNFDNLFRGPVTVRQTLEHSLNVPTARLASMVGVESIVSTLEKAGIQSPIPKVPSVSLGSADVTPMEMAVAYLTLANLGQFCKPRAILRIYDEGGELVYQSLPEFEERLPSLPTFQTVNMLKGVFTSGTAKWVSSLGLPLDNFAGKTGTTNENRDAWFVGFSPEFLVLVWVGFDEEEKVGLTGAAAALPLWINFIRASLPFLSTNDFIPPEDATEVIVDPASGGIATSRCPMRVKEYFSPGTEPHNDCPIH